MAENNRTDAISAVNAQIVPTVTNAVHRALLNDEIINAVEFRADVIGSETPSGGNVTIDYSDKDLATVTTTTGLTVSFTNLENGDSARYLAITKQAGNTISFSGATDFSEYTADINANKTFVLYQVIQKNSNTYVKAVNQKFSIGVESDITSGETYKIPSCKAVDDYVQTEIVPQRIFSSITEVVNQTNWSVNELDIEDNQYDVFSIVKEITIRCKVTCKVATDEIINVTSGYEPVNEFLFVGAWYNDSVAQKETAVLEFKTDGTINKVGASIGVDDIVYIYTTLRYRVS